MVTEVLNDLQAAGCVEINDEENTVWNDVVLLCV